MEPPFTSPTSVDSSIRTLLSWKCESQLTVSNVVTSLVSAGYSSKGRGAEVEAEPKVEISFNGLRLLCREDGAAILLGAAGGNKLKKTRAPVKWRDVALRARLEAPLQVTAAPAKDAVTSSCANEFAAQVNLDVQVNSGQYERAKEEGSTSAPTVAARGLLRSGELRSGTCEQADGKSDGHGASEVKFSVGLQQLARFHAQLFNTAARASEVSANKRLESFAQIDDDCGSSRASSKSSSHHAARSQDRKQGVGTNREQTPKPSRGGAAGDFFSSWSLDAALVVELVGWPVDEQHSQGLASPVVLAAVRVPCAAPSPLLSPLYAATLERPSFGSTSTTHLLSAALRDAIDCSAEDDPEDGEHDETAAADHPPLRWHHSLNAALSYAWKSGSAATMWAAAPLVVGWRGGAWSNEARFVVLPRAATAWRLGPVLVDPAALDFKDLANPFPTSSSADSIVNNTAIASKCSAWGMPDLVIDVWALALVAGVPTRSASKISAPSLETTHGAHSSNETSSSEAPAVEMVRALWWSALDSVLPSHAAALARQQAQQEAPQPGRGSRSKLMALTASPESADQADAGFSVSARLQALKQERAPGNTGNGPASLPLMLHLFAPGGGSGNNASGSLRALELITGAFDGSNHDNNSNLNHARGLLALLNRVLPPISSASTPLGQGLQLEPWAWNSSRASSPNCCPQLIGAVAGAGVALFDTSCCGAESENIDPAENTYAWLQFHAQGIDLNSKDRSSNGCEASLFLAVGAWAGPPSLRRIQQARDNSSDEEEEESEDENDENAFGAEESNFNFGLESRGSAGRDFNDADEDDDESAHDQTDDSDAASTYSEGTSSRRSRNELPFLFVPVTVVRRTYLESASGAKGGESNDLVVRACGAPFVNPILVADVPSVAARAWGHCTAPAARSEVNPPSSDLSCSSTAGAAAMAALTHYLAAGFVTPQATLVGAPLPPPSSASDSTPAPLPRPPCPLTMPLAAMAIIASAADSASAVPPPGITLAELCVASPNVAAWLSRAVGSKEGAHNGDAISSKSSSTSSSSNIHHMNRAHHVNLSAKVATHVLGLNSDQRALLNATQPLSSTPEDNSGGSLSSNGTSDAALVVLTGSPGSGRTQALLGKCLTHALSQDHQSTMASTSTALMVGPSHEALVAAAATLDRCLMHGPDGNSGSGSSSGGGSSSNGGDESVCLVLSHDDDAQVVAQLADLTASLALASPIATTTVDGGESDMTGDQEEETVRMKPSMISPAMARFARASTNLSDASTALAAARAREHSSSNSVVSSRALKPKDVNATTTTTTTQDSLSNSDGASSGAGLLLLSRLEEAHAAAGTAARQAAKSVVAERRRQLYGAAAAAGQQQPTRASSNRLRSNRTAGGSAEALRRAQQQEEAVQLGAALDALRDFGKRHGNVALTPTAIAAAFARSPHASATSVAAFEAEAAARLGSGGSNGQAPQPAAAAVRAAVSALEAMKRLPGWRLLIGLFPVVLATPRALTRWLPMPSNDQNINHHYHRNHVSSPSTLPSFGLVVVDDASGLAWGSVTAALARVSVSSTDDSKSGTLVLAGGFDDFALGHRDRAALAFESNRGGALETAASFVDGAPDNAAAILAQRSAFGVAFEASNHSRSVVHLPGSFRAAAPPTSCTLREQGNKKSRGATHDSAPRAGNTNAVSSQDFQAPSLPEFLEQLGLEQFEASCLANGISEIADLDELDDADLMAEIGLNKIQCRKVRAMLKASADETSKKSRNRTKSGKTTTSSSASIGGPFSSSSTLEEVDSANKLLPLPNVWARSLAARSSDDPLLPESMHPSGREKAKKKGATRAIESRSTTETATENDENEDPLAITTASDKVAVHINSSFESARSVLPPPPRVRVTSRSGWSEQRLGQRIDAPLDCVLAVARAIALAEASGNGSSGRSSGGKAATHRREKDSSRVKGGASPLAGSLLEDRAGAFGAVQHAVRKLRTCWVNAGEAAALGLELRRLQKVLPSTASLACCATSAAQAILLEATLQLLAANDAGSGSSSSSSQPVLAAVPIRVIPRDMAALGVSPDVLLVSFTHTAPSQSSGGQSRRGGGGGRTGGSSRAAVARSVEAVRHLVKWGANHQVHVFASPGTAKTSLHQWACDGNKKKHLSTISSTSTGPSFTQLGRLLLTSGNSTAKNIGGISSSGSSTSIVRGSALGDSTISLAQAPLKDWVNTLVANLKSFGDRSKDQPADLLSTSSSSLDARLWQGTWRGRSVRGIANYDAIVLCHDQACLSTKEQSTEARWANEILLELPRALRARGWSKVVHVFEADLQALDEKGSKEKPMSAMSGGVHVDAVVVSALARDLCSWVQVLGNLLVPPMDNDHGAFVAAASNAGPSVVEEKRSGMLPRTDVNVSTKNKGATVQRIAVQWPAGVTSGRVPRSVLESLEVAVRCSDKDTSSGVAPALGKGKGGSRASDEKTPYVRTGPLSVKQRDRLAATQLARTAAWVEARCLAPGRSYTVEVRVRTTTGGFVSLQEFAFTTPAMRPSPPKVLHAAVVLAPNTDSNNIHNSRRSRKAKYDEQECDGSVTGLCVVKACVAGPLNDLVATLHASAKRWKAPPGNSASYEEDGLCDGFESALDDAETLCDEVVSEASAEVQHNGESVDLLLHNLPPGHAYLIEVKAENSVGFCDSVASARVDVPAPPAPPSPPTSPLLSTASPLRDSPVADHNDDGDGLVDSLLASSSVDDLVATSPGLEGSPLPLQLVSDDDDGDNDGDEDANNTQLDCSDDDNSAFGDDGNDGNDSLGNADDEALGDGSGEGMFGDLLGGLEPEEGSSLEDRHNGSSDEENGGEDDDEAARPTLLLLPGAQMQELDGDETSSDVNTNDDDNSNHQKNLATLCVISPYSLAGRDAGSGSCKCISSALDVDCRAWDPACAAHSWVRVVSAKESFANAGAETATYTTTESAAAAAAAVDYGSEGSGADTNSCQETAPQSFSLFDLLSPPTAHVASTVAAASAADGSSVNEAGVIIAAEAAIAPPFYQIRVRNVSRIQVQPKVVTSTSDSTPRLRKDVGPWRLIALPRNALATSVLQCISTQARSAAQAAAMPFLRADKDGVRFDARLPSPADFLAVRKVRLRPKRAAAWVTWELLHGSSSSSSSSSSNGGGATAVELQLEEELSAMINGATVSSGHTTSSGVRPSDEVELQIRAFVCLSGPPTNHGSDAWTLEVPLVLATSHHRETQRIFIPAMREFDEDREEVKKGGSDHRPPVVVSLQLPPSENQPTGLRFAIAGALAAAQKAWGESSNSATNDDTATPSEAKLFCEVSGRLLRGRRENSKSSGSSGKGSSRNSSGVAGPWCVLGAHALRLPPQAIAPPPQNVADAIQASEAATTPGATGVASSPTATTMSGASVSSPFATAAAKWLINRCAGRVAGSQEHVTSSGSARNSSPSIIDEHRHTAIGELLPGALQRYPSTCGELQRLLMGCAGAMVEAEAHAAAHALSLLSKPPSMEDDHAGHSDMIDGAGFTNEDSQTALERVHNAPSPMVLGPALETGLRRRGLLLQPCSAPSDSNDDSCSLLDASTERAAMEAGPLGKGAAPDNASAEALAALVAALAAIAEEPLSKKNTSLSELATLAQRLQMPIAYTLYAANRDAHGEFAANAAAALALPALAEQGTAKADEVGQIKGGSSNGFGKHKAANIRGSRRGGAPHFGELPASVSAGLTQWGKGWLRQLQPCATVDLGAESNEVEREDDSENSSQESAWLLTELLGGALCEGSGKSCMTLSMSTGKSSGSSSKWANNNIDQVAEEDDNEAQMDDEANDELNGSMSDMDKENSQPSRMSSETPVKNKKTTKSDVTASSTGSVDSSSVDNGEGSLIFALAESVYDHSTGPLLSSTGGGGVFYLGLGEVSLELVNGQSNTNQPGDVDTTPLIFVPVYRVRAKPSQNHSATSSGVRNFCLMPEPGASPFFNPLLADVACPGLDNLDGSEESNVWAPLPLREWASHLLAPLFRKRARNAAARNARATKRTNNRHPSNTTISAKATARAAAPSGLRLSGVAALMQSGLVRASAVLFTSPPSAWPLAPRLSVLMYHSTWLHSSPAYALVTGCSSSLSTVIARTAQEGNEDLQTPQSCEGSSRTTSASAPHRRSASLAAWQKNHPVQIGPCDASQRRAVALALQGESFVLRGPPGCGKTNTLAAMAGALAAAGKRVLVVAKMPIALSCFEDKVRRMTTVTQSTGDGTPALACLTTAGFLRRGGNTFRSSADPAQCVTSEPRLAVWRRRRAMECFWVDRQPSSPTAECSTCSLPEDAARESCADANDVDDDAKADVPVGDLDSPHKIMARTEEVVSATLILPQTPQVEPSASSVSPATKKQGRHESDSAPSSSPPSECRVRSMLRSGDWKLLEPQPEVCLNAVVQPHAKLSPGAAAAHKWLPCAYLVRTGSASAAASESAVDALGASTPAKSRAFAAVTDGTESSTGNVPLARKATFVCGVCGADNATEAPFLKHLERHCDGRLWETGVYDARVLRSRRPGNDHTIAPTADNCAQSEDAASSEVVPDAGIEGGSTAEEAASAGIPSVNDEESSPHLSAWLGAQAAEREYAAETKAALLDEQMQALESRIRHAWALLRAPAVVSKPQSSSHSSCVVSRKQSLLAVVASAVHGAHGWEKHEEKSRRQVDGLPLPEQHHQEDGGQPEDHSQHSAENQSASRFFSDMCAPLADCPHCFARHGPTISETLRLLTAEPSGSSSFDGSMNTGLASGPSHATAATLLLRLQRDLRLTSGTAAATSGTEFSDGEYPASAADASEGTDIAPASCGCADKLVAALVSILPREDNESSSSCEDGNNSDGFSQRQLLIARCQQALLALEVRWLLGEAAHSNSDCSADSSGVDTEMPLPQGRLEVTAALRSWMSEVRDLEVERQAVSIELLRAKNDCRLYSYLANPQGGSASKSTSTYSRTSMPPQNGGEAAVAALEAAMNPALLMPRQAALTAAAAAIKPTGKKSAGSGGGGCTSSGSTAGSAKLAAQQGLWRLLETEAEARNMATHATKTAVARSAATNSTAEAAATSLGLLQRLFPVMCMTPEEAAHHLPAMLSSSSRSQSSQTNDAATAVESPPNTATPGVDCPFDVVLFDEASQLPTLEALPCVGRALQCVVVGDDKQLPPRDPSVTGLLEDALRGADNSNKGNNSSVNHSGDDSIQGDTAAWSDSDDREERDVSRSVTVSGRGVRRRLPLVPLTVHYRSGHQSLLAVSNELFYGGTLTSFPSAHDLKPPRIRPALLKIADKPTGVSSPSDINADVGVSQISLDIAQSSMMPDELQRPPALRDESALPTVEAHGLVRVVVHTGRMESNAGRKDRVENAIAEAVERYCPRNLHSMQSLDRGVSSNEAGYGGADDAWGSNSNHSQIRVPVQYSSSPQGYINVAQAEAVFRDVVSYMCRINGMNGSGNERRSMSKLSLGVITLNRPQRALLYAFVLAARHRLGLIPLSQANSKTATASASQSNASSASATPRAPAPANGGGGGSGGGSSSSSLNGFVRHPILQQPGDEVLFIQSIDQIQGEERDVILFSTLLAPKTATKETVVEASKGSNGSDDSDAGEDDEDDEDLLDKLEESGETSEEEEEEASDEDDFDDDSSRSSNEKGSKTSSGLGSVSGRRTAIPASAAKAKKSKKKNLINQRPRSRSRSRSPQQSSGGTRSLGLSYSTLAHAHGERLLNVGLTRAVRRMSVYFHPRMPAPPEHDPKPGKRAFGWLVRYLQYRPPLCPCATCAARFKRLVPWTEPPSSRGQDGERDSRGNGHGLSDGLPDQEELGIGSSDNSNGLTSARLAVSAWAKDRVTTALEQKTLMAPGTSRTHLDVKERPNVAAARTTVGVGEGKFQVDCAVSACASARHLMHAPASSSVSVQIALCLAEGAAAQSSEPCFGEEGGDGQSEDQSGSIWDVREQCGVVPAVLADPKLGWDGCATVGVSDALTPFLLLAHQQQQHHGANALLQGQLVNESESISVEISVVNKQLLERSPLSVVEALAQLAKGARTAAERVLTASLLLDPGDALPTSTEASLPQSTDTTAVVLGSLAWLNESCDAFERSSSRLDDHAALAALASVASQNSSNSDADDDNVFDDHGTVNTKASAPKTTGKKYGNKAKGNTYSEAGDSESASEDAAAAVAALDGRDVSTLKVTELKAILKAAKLPVGGRKQELIDRLNDLLASHAEAAGAESGETVCATELEGEASGDCTFSNDATSDGTADVNCAIDAINGMNDDTDGAAAVVSDFTAVNESIDDAPPPDDADVSTESHAHSESHLEDTLNESLPIEEVDQSNSNTHSSPETPSPQIEPRKNAERPDHLRYVQSYAEEPLSGESNVSAFTEPSTNDDDTEGGGGRADNSEGSATASVPASMNESSGGGTAASASKSTEGLAQAPLRATTLSSEIRVKNEEEEDEEEGEEEEYEGDSNEEEVDEDETVEDTAARVWERVRAFAKEGKGLRAIELFQQFDKDKSGGIDPFEFAAALARVGVTRGSLKSSNRTEKSINKVQPVSASVAAAVLKLADADHSGTLDFKELKHALQRPKTSARSSQATSKVDSKPSSRGVAKTPSAGSGKRTNVVSIDKRGERSRAAAEESSAGDVYEQGEGRVTSRAEDNNYEEDGDSILSPIQAKRQRSSETREIKTARITPARLVKSKSAKDTGGRVASSLVRGGDADRSEDEDEDSSSSIDDFIADDDEDEEFEESDDVVDSDDSDQQDEGHSDDSQDEKSEKVSSPNEGAGKKTNRESHVDMKGPSTKSRARTSSKSTEAARVAASKELRDRTDAAEAQQFAKQLPGLAKLLARQADGPHDSDDEDEDVDDDEVDDEDDDDEEDAESENSTLAGEESVTEKGNREIEEAEGSEKKEKWAPGKSALPRSLVDAAAEDDSSDDDSLPTSFTNHGDHSVSRELFDTDEEDEDTRS